MATRILEQFPQIFKRENNRRLVCAPQGCRMAGRRLFCHELLINPIPKASENYTSQRKFIKAENEAEARPIVKKRKKKWTKIIKRCFRVIQSVFG